MTEKQKLNTSEALTLVLLLAVLLVSALAVIYYKNLSRSVFIEIERNEQAMDRYEMEWKELRLKASTLAEQNQVETIAKERLKLVTPARDKTIYIKP